MLHFYCARWELSGWRIVMGAVVPFRKNEDKKLQKITDKVRKIIHGTVQKLYYSYDSENLTRSQTSTRTRISLSRILTRYLPTKDVENVVKILELEFRISINIRSWSYDIPTRSFTEGKTLFFNEKLKNLNYIIASIFYYQKILPDILAMFLKLEIDLEAKLKQWNIDWEFAP